MNIAEVLVTLFTLIFFSQVEFDFRHHRRDGQLFVVGGFSVSFYQQLIAGI
jgi:hypothetical protein